MKLVFHSNGLIFQYENPLGFSWKGKKTKLLQSVSEQKEEIFANYVTQ